MLAKADRRIYVIVWSTFILCLLPGWGLFRVASILQTEIQLDEGHLDTTCTVKKFSRFESCCTQEAIKSKMTIIPGDGFQAGEYESCVPDGYYTHCFVMADGCSEAHLSPKHFDQPPCLPQTTVVGDTFECFASCQAKTFTLEPEEANYHGLMLLFFGCALVMLLVTFTGSYSVMYFSHRDQMMIASLDSFKTPLTPRIICIRQDPAHVLISTPRTNFGRTTPRTRFGRTSPDEEKSPMDDPDSSSTGGYVVSGPAVKGGTVSWIEDIDIDTEPISQRNTCEGSDQSEVSFGGGTFNSDSTAEGIIRYEPDPAKLPDFSDPGNGSRRSSFRKKDPTRDSPPIKSRLEALRKRRVTWSREEPEFIEPPDPHDLRYQFGTGRRPSISLDETGYCDDADSRKRHNRAHTFPIPPREAPPTRRISLLKERRSDVPAPPNGKHGMSNHPLYCDFCDLHVTSTHTFRTETILMNNNLHNKLVE